MDQNQLQQLILGSAPPAASPARVQQQQPHPATNVGSSSSSSTLATPATTTPLDPSPAGPTVVFQTHGSGDQQQQVQQVQIDRDQLPHGINNDIINNNNTPTGSIGDGILKHHHHNQPPHPHINTITQSAPIPGSKYSPFASERRHNRKHNNNNTSSTHFVGASNSPLAPSRLKSGTGNDIGDPHGIGLSEIGGGGNGSKGGSMRQRTLLRSGTTLSKINSEFLMAHPYEMIDFEEPDGPTLQEHYRRQSKKTRAFQELANYLLSALITVLTTALFIALFQGTEKLGELRIETYAHKIEENKTSAALIFALWTSLLSALIPSLVIVLFAPMAIGSGMSDIISFLNGSESFKGQSFVLTFARVFGSLGIVVAGLFSGIDGPMARIGAGIAIRIVRWVRKVKFLRRVFYGEDPVTVKSGDRKSRISWKAVVSVLEQKRLRIFATLGAAVAIAAIFRAPVGGVMFAVEETTSFFEPSILIRTLFATIISYFMVNPGNVGSNLQAYSTRSRTLFPTNTDCETPPRFEDALLWILMGVLAAIVSTGWNRMLGFVQRLRMKYILTDLFTTNLRKKRQTPKSPTQKRNVIIIRLLEVAIVCIVTTCIVVLLPLGSGVDECRGLMEPVDHVEKLVPQSCFEALNAFNSVNGGNVSSTSLNGETFIDCRHNLRTVCLPYEMKSDYENGLSVLYAAKLGKVNALEGVGGEIIVPGAGEGEGTGTVEGGGGGETTGNTENNSTTTAGEPVSTGGRSVSSTGTIVEEATTGVLSSTRSSITSTSVAVKKRRSEEVVHTSTSTATTSTAGGQTEGTQSSGETTHNPEEEAGGHHEEEEEKPLPIPINSTTPASKLIPPLSKSFVYSNLLQKNEEKECYYPLRSLLYSTPDRQLRLLLTRGLYNLLTFEALAIFFVCYMILSIGTYYIALPTDLVIPNLVLGSVAGRLFGLVINIIKASLNLPPVDPGLYALLGLSAFWSGTSRLVMTVTIIALEVTSDFEALPAILIVSFISAWVSQFLEQMGWGESLYHTEMELNGTPFLSHEAPHEFNYICVNEICQTKNLITLQMRRATVEDCIKALESGHGGFPLVDDWGVNINAGASTLGLGTKVGGQGNDGGAGGTGRFSTRAKRNRRFRPALLREREESVSTVASGVKSESVSESIVSTESDSVKVEDGNVNATANSAETINTGDAIDSSNNNTTSQSTSSSSGVRPVGWVTRDRLAEILDLMRVDGATAHSIVDMSSICNVSPTVVPKIATAAKVFKVMRTLGLRQCLVVDDEGCLYGIVTRTDLINCEHVISHSAHDHGHHRRGKKETHDEETGHGSEVTTVVENEKDEKDK
ncbi:hypothetical protein HDU76_008714 [Blyttiomyces sp. JEL0837]|nr:hypothetical protein HDU76_008714 [Blyttiomyces sp. JEL0837]